MIGFAIVLISSLLILTGCTDKKGDVELIWRNLSNKKCNSEIGLYFDYPTDDVENDYMGIRLRIDLYGLDDSDPDLFFVKACKTKWLKTDGKIIPHCLAAETPFNFADYETPTQPGKVEIFITDGEDNSVHTVKSKIDGRTLKISGITLWVVE